MFAKRLFQKAAHRHHHQNQREKGGLLTPDDLDFRINVHYGVPNTASILAFDPIQRLLAIATLDGRIKLIGGENIEGLLISPKLLPYKYLEFLQNQGLLIGIANNNEIQIWNLEGRSIACSLQWESNITAFSIISGSSFMYVGDEYGWIYVLKYDTEDGQLSRLPYHLCPDNLTALLSSSNHQTVVGVLPQPYSSGNRLLIAYESGLIILWDVSESHIVVVRGDKVLQLKGEVDHPHDVDKSIVDGVPVHDTEEKEISALCWASIDGSILAVGYIDGDILFWDTTKDSPRKNQQARLSQNVVKLQLSSANKRLPIIVLHWLGNSKSRNRGDGQLLVYGGDEIGSEEVITVLHLEWSSGMEDVRCVNRVDLTLRGSFADMILLPSVGATWNDKNASLFVLTNPGRVTIYDSASLSSSESQPGIELPVTVVNFPACIPIADPLMTVAEIFSVCGNMEGASKTAAMNLTLPGDKRWPLTGGVSNHLSFSKDSMVHRVYVAGYQDGSVRIWDATYPVFSLLCVLPAVDTLKNLVDSSGSVTTISLCPSTLRLAVGSDSGLIQLYNLSNSDDTSFHFVTETERQVQSLPDLQGPRRRAVFKLQESKIHALEFTNSGSKLFVGYECSRMAVLDVHSSSIVFITDSSTKIDSPLVSAVCRDFIHESTKSTNETSPKVLDNCTQFIFMLTKDANIHVFNGNNGCMIGSRPTKLKRPSAAIALHVIEIIAASRSVNDQKLPNDDNITNELSPNSDASLEMNKCETNGRSSDRNPFAHSLKDSFVLLCCKDSLRIYPAKSLIQGESKSTYKVELSKPCCWTSVFMKGENTYGLILFYQTGELEIRSLPDLQVVKEYSLLADLRWNFKVNMERMMSSADNGHISLANRSEVAFISILDGENEFRIPESLPNLHDEVLAAAASAAISVNSVSSKKQGVIPGGIIGGIVRGLKGQKPNKLNVDSNSISDISHLEHIFMRNPFPDRTTPLGEEDDELDIDDIEIDEPEPIASTSTHEVDNKDQVMKSDREKLFDGGTEIKPRLRTREEIVAKYRKAGDAASAAGQAREKLLERQERLEKISRRTEDLQNGAEDFASLANELVKVMEKRKWYHI